MKATTKQLPAVFAALALFGSALGFGGAAGSAVFGNGAAAQAQAQAAAEQYYNDGLASAGDPAFEYELTAALQASNSNSVSSVFKAVSNAVVSISTKVTTTTRFGQTYDVPYAGSGVIFKQDADKIYIVTNYHVVEGANNVTVSLDDTHQATAHYVGGDEQADLAVISVKKQDAEASLFKGYTVASFGDSAAVEVGDAAIAIGNALGEGKSATLGIISALAKEVQVDSTRYTALQTDAAINHGNSGGALVNADGKVIGINAVKLEAVGVEGMGYAIPSNFVQETVNNILNGAIVGKPYFGIAGRDVTESTRNYYGFKHTGVYTDRVYPNSTASAIGLAVGDIIYSYNGKPVATSEQLSGYIQSAKVGTALTIEVERGGQAITLTGAMKAAPSSTAF